MARQVRTSSFMTPNTGQNTRDATKTENLETQRKNLAMLVGRYRLWGQALVPQMPFSQFMVSLEKLATKKAFKERVAAMQQDGVLFSSDPLDDPVQPEPAAAAAAAAAGVVDGEDKQQDKQQDDEVIVLREHMRGHKDDDDDEFDPSMIDPDDLEPAATTTTAARTQNHDKNDDDDDFDPSMIDPDDLEPV